MTLPPSLRVTGEADLIKRQLRQPGMYPPPKTPLPSTLGFVSRPTPTFQPIAPDASPEPVNTPYKQTTKCWNVTRKFTTLWTTDTHRFNSTPTQHKPPQSVVPPQPATPQSHNSDNIHPHTQPQKTPQSSPTTQPKQQSLIGTNTNPATQPSIPATETCESVSSSSLQHIPKSANGYGMKSSKPESRSYAPDG